MSESSPVYDPIAEPYFQAAAEGRLVVQRCDSCQALRWPPLAGCPECRSRRTTWVEVTPSGTIWSFVVYHRAFSAALKDEIPYTVAMVQLDDGPYVVGRMVDGTAALNVGDRVAAEISPVSGVPTVRWRLVSNSPSEANASPRHRAQPPG